MTDPRLLVCALIASAAVCGPAVAQTNATPAPDAFAHAIRAVCGPNVAGRLPFDLMNGDLNAVRVVLADASDDPATLAAFSDWAGQPVEYGFVPAASGRINLGVDETLAWCRVAVLDVTPADVAAMRADLATLDGWAETGVIDGETTQYLATLDEDVIFVRVTLPSPGSRWGAGADLIVTVMNPAAQEQ